MSRIAPDIPELEAVPYIARSGVYTQAWRLAVRSPLTWVMGGILFCAGVGIGANQGSALLGSFGAVFGALVGAAAGVWSFVKLILPWCARRSVSEVIADQRGTGPAIPPEAGIPPEGGNH